MGFKVTGDLEVTGAVKIGADTLTATGAELNFVDGVTSAIQTQIDSKAGLANWGQPLGGYKFDGVDDYVTVADNANLDFGTGDFSLEAFIYFKAQSSSHTILMKGSGTPRYGIQISALNKLAPLHLTSDGTLQPIIEPAITAGFKHIVVTHTRSGNQLTYLNGALINTSAMSTYASTVSNAQALEFSVNDGASFSTDDIYLSRLYNRALTASEVTSLYNNGRPDLASLPYDMIGGSQTSLVTGDNSTFASDTAFWAKDTGVTIADGVCHFTAVGASSALYKTSLLTIGKKYLVTYTVSGYTAGTIKANLGGALGASVTADGTYSEVIQATGVNFYIFTSGASTTLDIDNITVYQVGCVAEYLPENAGKIGWIETQNSLHGQTSGSPVSLNAENRPLIYRDIKLNIATATPTLLTALVPKGYKIVSIVAKGSDALTAIKIGTSSSGEQIVASATATATGTILTLASTANDGFSITADMNVYVEHTTAGQTMDVTFQLEKINL